MEAKKINLEEWDYFGEGGSGRSYCNKKNGNILLKLNNADVPAETTFAEYSSSKYVFELGIPAPEVYDFVTDGERFGYTARRIKGKMSYARILSQEPGMTEELASRFAGHALALHGKEFDASVASDWSDVMRTALGDLSFVPEDVAVTVRKCLDGLAGGTSLLHGDMNPGNLITFEGRDYWIGINGLTYGDPCVDIADMYVICNFMPPKEVGRLYHSDVRTFRKFFDSFMKAYFGDGGSSEVADRIRNAAILKCCAMIKESPEKASLYIPLLRGQKLRFRIAMLLGK